jgi:hypothetical protein
MKKFYLSASLLLIIFLTSCGTPNDPESIIGGDGGYKIVGKLVTMGYAQDVVVNDTLAFVAQGEGGLMIVDIANPYSPIKLSFVAQELKGYGYKVANKDSIVYVATGGFGVSIVDVGNPLNPTAPFTNIDLRPAKGFAIMNNFLFTAVGEHGFQIAYAPPENPTYLDIRGYTITPGYAQGLTLSPDNNFLLIACGEMGFAAYDISGLQNGWGTYPLFGWVDTPGYAENIAVQSDLPIAYIACGTGGLVIADYSDSGNVKIIGSFATGGYAKEVYYQNNKVYVTTELRGLQIIDVSNIYSPVRIGTVETSYALGVTADDKYIYVTDENEGLLIVSKPGM